MEFLKKWWKLAVGFFATIILFFIGLRNKSGWSKFHENSKNNLEDQIAVEKKAGEDLAGALEEADEKFFTGLEKLEKKDSDSRKKIKLEKDKERKELKNKSLAKSIAELTGAEHVKTKKD